MTCRPAGSSFSKGYELKNSTLASIARYMFPLASSPNAKVRELAMQRENMSAVATGLNFAIKEQEWAADGTPRAVEVSGKSGDEVVPATYSEPEASTAIPATDSIFEPPRYV